MVPVADMIRCDALLIVLFFQMLVLSCACLRFASMVDVRREML